jgi:hypothetical protein
MSDFYERYMLGEHPVSFDKIGFFNFGFWKGSESSVEMAQLNLIETLVEFRTRCAFLRFEINRLERAATPRNPKILEMLANTVRALERNTKHCMAFAIK